MKKKKEKIPAVYYSCKDKVTRKVKFTGRNSRTLKELKEQLVQYFNTGNIKPKEVEMLKLKNTKTLASMANWVVIKHLFPKE